MTQPSSDNQLERDLQHAQQFGRWLSDEEMARLAEEEEVRSDVDQRREVGRRKLVILIALSVLIPPLWPLALVLTLLLSDVHSFRANADYFSCDEQASKLERYLVGGS